MFASESEKHTIILCSSFLLLLEPLQASLCLYKTADSWLENRTVPIQALVQSLGLFRWHQLSIEVSITLSYVLKESLSVTHVNAPSSDFFRFSQLIRVRGHFEPVFLV